MIKTKIIPVDTLGRCDRVSPLARKKGATFISEENSVIYSIHKSEILKEASSDGLSFFELAGPRSKIYFDPKELTCGIVTCGGLCPGLNDVIRSIVIELHGRYGATKVLGFKYGYQGLTKKTKFPPTPLTPDNVDEIHQKGGTILSSSRGKQDAAEMVDTLVKKKVKILFTIGGDGTMRGAATMVDYIRKKGLDISVISVPKTIDNDISYVKVSFGFQTAVQASMGVIASAHIEAKGAPNGIGLVKLMGRHSGFIASNAALANSDVNYCFIPEVPFRLKGKWGLLEVLKERLNRKQHVVIVVAEGAGQHLIKGASVIKKDASGNIKFKDIGSFLKSEIEAYFKKTNMEVNIKYIDPSYTIRSIPANAFDSSYCLALGQSAVHAGMTGRTNMVMGYANHHFTHVPISMAVKKRNMVNPNGRLWKTVMESTLQPASMFEKKDK